MPNIWIYKDDETKQCDEANKGVPLHVMQKELEALGAKVLSSEKRQDCVARPRVCGAPTGQVNAYKISLEDWEKVSSGFVGPLGFKAWTCDDEVGISLRGGEIPWPLVAQMLRGSTAFGQPVLVRELIGMKSRYYEYGSVVTEDYRPDRVNIVTDTGSNTIKEIWFG